MSRKRVVKLLEAFGHSAMKAVEIAIDYERGDHKAKQWVEMAIRVVCV